MAVFSDNEKSEGNGSLAVKIQGESKRAEGGVTAKVAERAGWGGEDGSPAGKNGACKERTHLPLPRVTRSVSPTRPGYGGWRARGRIRCMGIIG